MSRSRSFFLWARRLDARVLGPGGLFPDGMGYFEYWRATIMAPLSPMWVRLGRPVALGVMLLTQGEDDGLHLALFFAAFLAVAVMYIRADRDIRVAARRRMLEGPSAQ